MNEDRKKYLQGVLGVEKDGIIGPITKKAYADKLISIAKMDIGVFETSENHGDGIEKFWQAVDYSEGYKDRAPYCAAAVAYWIKSMGVFGDHIRPKTALAFGFEQWARDIGLTLEKPPKRIKRGDLVIFAISHVGVATSDSDGEGNFSTIEANTSGGKKGSQRNGNGIYAKSRNISAIRSIVRL